MAKLNMYLFKKMELINFFQVCNKESWSTDINIRLQTVIVPYKSWNGKDEDLQAKKYIQTQKQVYI